MSRHATRLQDFHRPGEEAPEQVGVADVERRGVVLETIVYSWSSRWGRSSTTWVLFSGRGSGASLSRSAAARASGAHASAPSNRA